MRRQALQVAEDNPTRWDSSERRCDKKKGTADGEDLCRKKEQKLAPNTK